MWTESHFSWKLVDAGQRWLIRETESSLACWCRLYYHFHWGVISCYHWDCWRIKEKGKKGKKKGKKKKKIFKKKRSHTHKHTHTNLDQQKSLCMQWSTNQSSTLHHCLRTRGQTLEEQSRTPPTNTPLPPPHTLLVCAGGVRRKQNRSYWKKWRERERSHLGECRRAALTQSACMQQQLIGHMLPGSVLFI